MPKPDVPNRLTGRDIGLALSGGGHRATAFALGGLLALSDIGHHQSVRDVASVSGGSITSGFLALQGKPFSKMTSKEVECTVAALATQLAGHRGLWAIGIVGLILPTAIWAGALAFGVEGADRWWLPWVAALAGGLWGAVLGTRGGGTLWAWWGTWLYLASIVPTAVVIRAVATSDLSASLKWFLSPAIALVLLLLISQRHRVAGLAIDRALAEAARRPVLLVLGPKRAETRGRRLAEISAEPLFVFCATEMHTGFHAYFAREFVYSRGFGIGRPSDLRLHTAIQSSANFPVGFPLRILGARRFGFEYGAHRRKRWMILTDGGVYDNLGVAWFLEPGVRRSGLQLQNGERFKVEPHIWKAVFETEWLTPWWTKQKSDKHVLAYNAAPAYRWKKLLSAWLPGLGELPGFANVALTMYNNVLHARHRSAQYDDTVVDYRGEEPETLLFEIDSSPFEEAERWWGHDAFGWGARPLAQYLATGDPNRSLNEPVPEEAKRAWEGLQERNSRVGTHLNPLGARRTAELMYHAYMLTVAHLHLFFSTPLVDPLPTIDDFMLLTRGQNRKAPSGLWIVQQGATYRRSSQGSQDS